jgi:hypothetical protein
MSRAAVAAAAVVVVSCGNAAAGAAAVSCSRQLTVAVAAAAAAVVVLVVVVVGAVALRSVISTAVLDLLAVCERCCSVHATSGILVSNVVVGSVIAVTGTQSCVTSHCCDA